MGDTKRADPIVASALLAVVVVVAIDLVLDAPLGMSSFHLAVEGIMAVLSLGLAIYLWMGWVATSRSLASVRRTLESHTKERDEWRERTHVYVDGLNRVIDQTFRGWGLTAAETEVAWHLLAGHTDREIARRTGRSNRTVSTHAVSVYRKSALGGRAELAAFFLSDLIQPGGTVKKLLPESDSTVSKIEPEPA